jgi:signal transduction histidine kinase
MTELLTIELAHPEDVFALRQYGRAATAAIGCDEPDQVRFATALSEIGREIVSMQAKSSVTFSFDDEVLAVTIATVPLGSQRAGNGLDAARRLVEDVEVDKSSEESVARVSLRRRAVGDNRVGATSLRTLLRRSSALSPLEEMRLQNRDLLNALESVRAQREELVQLNAELEVTNRGVLAMYSELEGELEETNRGVVALYAELDEKTQHLNNASEAKTRFFASVSHELRGPVNAILGLLRLALEPGDGDAERRRQLSLAFGSANDLLALVNDLLDLAKAESGRLEPEIADTDLVELFGDLRGTLRPLTKPGVELIVETPAVRTIETDRTLLAQVLRNLITNALKFTESGAVTLTAREVSPLHLEIAVSDTGIGISGDDCERIFDEFYQVRGPLQARQKGTGLGLSYARQVSRALGGELTVESTVGMGSTFYVCLPMRWIATINAPKTPGRVELLPAPSIGTVLIVDDDARFREVLRGLLQGAVAEILEAPDGLQALDIMNGRKPNLVFMDLRMPNMDGAEVMSEMAAEPTLRDVPVVMVTSAELDAANRPILGKATALLAKSNVSRQTLREAIAKAGTR